uniref:Uncharacterized protein n=1 Tax=Ananas comosus var. bracteatus TaxID=296719 RepID=A0A6V7P3J9_ANACO|nr:unnamed protein product [Ananas comosus var. bracteatus]
MESVIVQMVVISLLPICCAVTLFTSVALGASATIVVIGLANYREILQWYRRRIGSLLDRVLYSSAGQVLPAFALRRRDGGGSKCGDGLEGLRCLLIFIHGGGFGEIAANMYAHVSCGMRRPLASPALEVPALSVGCVSLIRTTAGKSAAREG